MTHELRSTEISTLVLALAISTGCSQAGCARPATPHAVATTRSATTPTAPPAAPLATPSAVPSEPEFPSVRKHVPVSELAKCVDDDRTDDFEWLGPWFDESGKLVKPLPDSFVVATTTAWHRPPTPEDAPKGRFATAERQFGVPMRKIFEKLPSTAGFMGLRVASSDKCGAVYTVSLWTSEQAIDEFAYKGVHASQIGRGFRELLGFETRRWRVAASEPLPTFASTKVVVDQLRREETR